MIKTIFLFFIMTITITTPCYALISGINNGQDADSPNQRIDSNKCNSPWAGVVSIEINNSTYSGVVIGKYWILTAAHAIQGGMKNPTEVTIHIPCKRQQFVGNRIFMHPQYPHQNMQGITLYDIGLIRLSKPLPDDIPHYWINFQIIRQGTIGTLIGYGASGYAGDKILQAASVRIKRKGENALDTILIDKNNQQLAYEYDFDGPDASTNYQGGLTLGNRRETEVAPGDSGGPVFIKTKHQKMVLVGINTFRMNFPMKVYPQPPTPPAFGSGGGGILLNSVASWLLHLVPDLHIDDEPIEIKD